MKQSDVTGFMRPLAGVGVLCLSFAVYLFGSGLVQTDHPMMGYLVLVVLTAALWKSLFWKKFLLVQRVPAWLLSPLWPIGLYLLVTVLSLYLPTSSANQAALEEVIRTRPWQTAALVGIVAPVIEEMIFRGLLARYFFEPISSVLLAGSYLIASAALFALVHGATQPLDWLIYGGAGLSFAWLYLATGKLRYPIALHMVNNCLAFLLVLF